MLATRRIRFGAFALAIALLACGNPARSSDVETLADASTEPVALADGSTLSRDAVADAEPCPLESCPPPGFVFVPGGVYMMGSPSGAFGSERVEQPPRPVRISRSLLVSATEITIGQWREVMGGAPSTLAACGDDCPVHNVSLFDAMVYANALSERDALPACYFFDDSCSGDPSSGCGGEAGCNSDFRCDSVPEATLDCAGYRVPTEAEWEYLSSARDGEFGLPAGDPTDEAQQRETAGWNERSGPVAYETNALCDSSGTIEPCGPRPVGLRPANRFGLFDISGNIQEWTSSVNRDVTYGSEPLIDPLGQSSSLPGVEPIEQYALRGGSWREPARQARVSRIGRRVASSRDYAIGFRVVRSVQSETLTLACGEGVEARTGECWRIVSAEDDCPSLATRLTMRESAWVSAYWQPSLVDAERGPSGWLWSDGEPVVPTPFGVGDCLRASADGRLRAVRCDDQPRLCSELADL